MADNMSYIGVAMGLDVSDLKAGLSEANKQIQLANSEFKAASSGMDDWSKSIEGVSAKVKQLDTVLNAQKAKLAGLTAEYEKVAKEQGEGSEAARKLKVQINNQQAVVNKTQKEFDNYSDTLKQAEAGTLDLAEASLKGGKAVKDMGDNTKDATSKMDGISGVAKGVVGGIAAIGAAAVAAVGSLLSLAESTQEYREDTARLDAAFEASGKSAESAKNTYTELFRAIGESDTAVEASQQIALLAESEEEAAKWADLATGVVGTFGDALKPETFFEAANETMKLGEATGAYVQMLEGTGMSVDEFNAGLAACTTESEKQAYMLKISEQQLGAAGKAYEEQAGSILDAREASANLTEALANLGAIAEPIMTTLKQLAADLLTEMTPFITVIGEGLTGVLNGTAGAADTLAQGLSGLLSSLLEKLVSALPTVLSTVVTLISTLLPQIISTLTGFLPTLISTLSAQLPIILQAIISGFSQILLSLGSMLPTLIPIIIDAVLMITTTLIDNIGLLIDAGISLLLGLADGLIQALPLLISKIPVIIQNLLSAFSQNLPKLIRAGIDLLLSLKDGLLQAIPDLIRAIPDIIKSIVDGLISGIPDLIAAGGELLAGLFEGFLDPKAIWEAVKSLGESIVDAAKSFFGIKSPSRLMRDEIGEFLGEGVGVGMLDSLPSVKKNLNKFGDFITDNLGGIKSGLSLGVSGVGGYAGATAGGGRVVNIDARQTLNYNGNLSLKEVKQREREHLVTVKTKMRAEGLI